MLGNIMKDTPKLLRLSIKSRYIYAHEWYRYENGKWTLFLPEEPYKLGTGWRSLFRSLRNNNFAWASPLIRPGEEIVTAPALPIDYLRSAVLSRNELGRKALGKRIRKLKRMSNRARALLIVECCNKGKFDELMQQQFDELAKAPFDWRD
jgi:hypothetical protein